MQTFQLAAVAAFLATASAAPMWNPFAAIFGSDDSDAADSVSGSFYAMVRDTSSLANSVSPLMNNGDHILFGGNSTAGHTATFTMHNGVLKVQGSTLNAAVVDEMLTLSGSGSSSWSTEGSTGSANNNYLTYEGAKEFYACANSLVYVKDEGAGCREVNIITSPASEPLPRVIASE